MPFQGDPSCAGECGSASSSVWLPGCHTSQPFLFKEEKMTRVKFLLAALCTVAIVAVVAPVPAAHAQSQNCIGISNCTVHVVGDGSSAQFLTAGIAADALALTVPNVGPPTTSALPAAQNCSGLGDANATYHWSFSSGANILDERSGANILPQPGNIWVVWIAACSDTTGSTNISHIWTDVSEDSTVGVRTFFAQETNGSGAVIQVTAATGSTGANSIAQVLMPDDAGDVALPGAIASALGTSSAGTANLHVNVGLTDIRPEDALFATQRSNSELVTKTYAGLGYTTGINTIGGTISTAQGTDTFAQPVSFGLGGGTDPISKIAVPAAVTIPIGAAPTVFYLNNQSDSVYPVDLKTGVEPFEKDSKGYPLAKLYDGSTDCNNQNAAFDLFYNTSTKATQTTAPTTAENIYLVLREPLSGTMNTTEFNLFRTDGDPDDSQEVGVNPSTDNPLNQTCPSGGGNRERAIGTGEVVNAITGKGNSENSGARVLGYIFDSYANRHKFGGASNYNYLTEDGVDPIGPNPSTGDVNYCGGVVSGGLCADATQCGAGVSCSPAPNLPQNPPNCNSGNAFCPYAYTAGGTSFPNLRNGTYKSWSIYRWVVQKDIDNETDPYGPAHLAYAAANTVDDTVADYVPFVAGYSCGGVPPGTANFQYCYNNGQCASNPNGTSCLPEGVCTGGSNAGAACTGSGNGGGVCTGGGYCTDGLQVYRSHFERCGSYKNAGTGDGMSSACNTGDEVAPDNGPLSAFGTLGGNNDVTGEVEAGGDVGGLVVALNSAHGWCPTLSGKAQTVSVTNGSGTVAWSAGFLFTASSSGNAAKFLDNLNLVSGNTIWIDGSTGWVDYTITAVNTDKSISVSPSYTGKTGKFQACFDGDESVPNTPGVIGVIN
jgi:hypothetical protein